MRNYQVQGNLFVDESRLCEFLIILPLPNDVRENVLVFKEELEVLYGNFSSRQSIPHINVCDFLLFEHRTFDIMSFFKNRLQGMDSFTLSVNGFKSFDKTKSIFLDIENSEEYKALQTEVDVTRQMLKLRKNYFQRAKPYISIAKNLHPDVYCKAKEVFYSRDYSEKFEVKHMDILKFDFITRKYQLFGQIPFQGQ